MRPLDKILTRVVTGLKTVLVFLGAVIKMDEPQKEQLWGIIDPDGSGKTSKDSVMDLLEMVLQPEGDNAGKDHGVIEGLRLLSQGVFKDADLVMVDAGTLIAAIDSYAPQAKNEIIAHLQKIERGGKISRTKLDDLIDSLEEVDIEVIKESPNG